MKKIWFLLLLSISLVYAQTDGQTQAMTSAALEDNPAKQNVQSEYVKENLMDDNRNARKVQKNKNAKLKAEHRVQRTKDRLQSREERTKNRELRKSQRVKEREARKAEKGGRITTKDKIKELATPPKKEV